MKTFSAKQSDVVKKWVLIDAEGQAVGRIASRAAAIIRGKTKPIFTPHVDTGDHIVVINAEKVRLTGNKLATKTYYRHSGYTGNLKSVTAEKLLAGPHADRVVMTAVRGMLPKNSLGRKMMKKLRVYAGPEHPHAAQKPEELNFG